MSKELKTGIISLLIIAIGIWGFNFLKGKNLLSPTSRYFFVEFANINGLTEASLVTINGLKVGKIERISFNKNPNKKGKLLVKFSMTEDVEFSKNSAVKIYSASLMGEQNIAIIPDYSGVIAVSNDTLKGSLELSMLDGLGDKVDPFMSNIGTLMVSADSLLKGVNQIIDPKARKSLNTTILNLESTVGGLNKTLASADNLIAGLNKNLPATLNNFNKISNDFSKVSDDLAKTDLGEVVGKLESTLNEVNVLMANLNKGEGTIGKLMSDDTVYDNLASASKELEELLREVKLNPNRFVHLSLFGKKNKTYNKDNNQANVSNQ